MASAAKRAKQRKKRKQRAVAGTPLSALDPDKIPRHVRNVMQATNDLVAYLEDAEGDLDRAADAALDDIAVSVQRICELAAPYDAFDVIENVRFSQTPLNVETYRETEHEG